jgi:hypothetical protein
MLNYNANLKDKARQLRKNLTDSEKAEIPPGPPLKKGGMKGKNLYVSDYARRGEGPKVTAGDVRQARGKAICAP